MQLKDIFLLLSPVAIAASLVTLYIFPCYHISQLSSCLELSFPACLSSDVTQLTTSSLLLILGTCLGVSPLNLISLSASMRREGEAGSD